MDSFIMLNSRKGHQGFTAKYPTLGDTKHIRVPNTIAQDLKVMLVLLEAIAAERGVDGVKDILDSICDRLGESVP